MKNAYTILSHLTNQPQFKFLKQQVCYKKYIKLLGTKYQKAIAFVYIRNETLFVALTHPGFKMELNYNKDLLRSVLTQLAKHDKACEIMQAEKIVIFHSKYHTIPHENEDKDTVPYYNELATPDFVIASKDDALTQKFENIKKQIVCNK